ncbi:hypothetical protein [Pseudonocardia endophytica]|uniref:Uncharacterized protein n=1 Tax=Pseudonocardia endophytica TaxID=401976 RepID=A0A4R1I238_PSEEN|nr:hypothetical protein [Pseudonocardia endophytica]TCK27330.1 hypothetical protein EV378_3200 [Pseudonocardia endophytica]
MIRDAELFVMAEDVLVEVIGRVRGEDRTIEMRPLADRDGDVAESIRRRLARHVRDDLQIPDLLAGREPEDPGSIHEVLGDDTAGAARAAAEKATVAARDADESVADLLRRLTIERALLSHEIAMHLGSRACPLTEELARGLCELTEPEPEHARWVSEGLFRAPLTPFPDDVSWRDRWLMVTGRDPHPFVPH